ncbi:Peroxiredoxin [Bryocella elongata]|uniref:Peroxiredoxin n=1 Tax=Bryocella elongata TaxID=863522 RepID=A0A1H5ZKL2_9BACT|nr:TlpA disulfide reductase family protein [Bryocella elongata]SEG37058.1 Peroxiredoxin [Bryocella elongata]
MKISLAVFALAGLLTASSTLQAEDWRGTATVHEQPVPVHLVLSDPAADGSVTGAFINGPEKQVSTSGELKDGHLVLRFDYFARKLEGDIKDGKLEGTFGGARGGYVPLTLQRDPKPAEELSASQVKAIAGDWEIAVQSPKGESAWTLRVTPASGRSAEAKAVILRIDGDTGGLYGGYDAAAKAYQFTRFGASGSAVYTITSNADGTLTVVNPLAKSQQWSARRPAEARKENLAPPTQSSQQTSVIDPSKPLAFTATDLDGHTVTNRDPRLEGKVVIVAIGGSWCPNCHDEAPFLEELYKRYHDKGLEIVDLSFEEPDQLKNPTRLRAFQKKYGLEYPILLAGTPDQLNEKLPQGKNLNCWPTAFFIGRDGLVKEAHAGFSGPATGKAYVDLKAETEALIERLLRARPARKLASARSGSTLQHAGR